MTLDEINANYFEGRLSEETLELLGEIPDQRAEVRAFAERACRFMHEARIRAEDFSVRLAWELGMLVPRILPGVWGGTVPPLTRAGRHARLDEYVATNPWSRLGDGAGFLDLGCGYPPTTTVETARRFPGWRVMGADPMIGRYLVHDERGDFALFDDRRNILFFQVGRAEEQRWDALFTDPLKTKTRFVDLLDRLLPRLAGAGPDELAEATDGAARLVRNPALRYEGPNLRFVNSGIANFAPLPGSDSPGVEAFDMVRCLNVLFYYDGVFRQRALDWTRTRLRRGGLFLCGADGPGTSHARYTVYRKEEDALRMKEFAFSLDNLRPLEIVAWFSLYDDDHETTLLARLVGMVRSDAAYRPAFDAALDRMLEEYGICPRGRDGYLGDLAREMSVEELTRGYAEIHERLDREGFVERAALVLRQAGLEAWRNDVGHVGIAGRSIESLGITRPSIMGTSAPGTGASAGGVP